MDSNGGPYYRSNNNSSSSNNPDDNNGPPDYNNGGHNPNNFDPRFYGDVQDPAKVLEALLPPLKQLDINSLPPDLLAYLLKTKRIDQLVANNAGGQRSMGGDYYPPQQQQQQQPQQQQSYGQQQQQSGMMSQAPRGQGQGQGSYNNEWPGQQPRQEPQQYRRQEQQQPRQHQQQPPRQQQQQQQPPRQQQQQHRHQQQPQQQHRQQPQQWNQSVPSQQHQQNRGRQYNNHNNRNGLSPLAKEFIPRTYNNQGHQDGYYDPNWSLDAGSIGGPRLEEMLNQLDLPDASDFDANADQVLTTITDTINQLAVNPADFDRAARKTTGVLKKYLNDPDTLGVIVTLIFEQSVSNANFCYSGARLCQEFHKNDIAVAVDNTRVSFKNMLIERCQQEFTSCLETLNLDPDMQGRAPGLLMFLAELYLNFQLEMSGKSTKNVLFGLAAIELMTALVSSKPVSNDMIKCIFRTLKLLGWELDHDPKPEVKRDLDKLIKELSFLMVSSDTPEQSKQYLEMLFELRKKNWNKSGGEEPTEGSSGAYAAAAPTNQSVYYELPDNVEEEDLSLLIDDEPEEVRKAYEEFLRATGGQ